MSKNVTIDDLNNAEAESVSAETIEALFADIDAARISAAEKVLCNARTTGNAQERIGAASVLVFMKGNNSHDYKFSSAVLEEYYHVSPALPNQYLATSVFNLRGAT